MNAFDYSQTPASNDGTPPDGAPEDMPPSGVNNTIRKMMANIAGAFTVYTAGGTADAQTVTMDPALTAYSTAVRLAFIPVADNTGACTLNVNGLGAKSIKDGFGNDLQAGDIEADSIHLAQYDGTNFILLNPAKERMYAGYVGADGTTGNDLPAGWSASKFSTGIYDVTHNLGTELGLAVSLTAYNTNSNGVVLASSTDLMTRCQFQDMAGSLLDTAFYFIIMIPARNR